jgi:ABC-type multidrug transport system ATPase subunit
VARDLLHAVEIRSNASNEAPSPSCYRPAAIMRFDAKGISKAFEGPPIFRDVSISAERGLVAVTGRNGSGKSTLVKIFAGLMRPTKGTVQIFEDSQQIDERMRRRAIGWASPEVEFPDELTAEENLLLLARAGGIDRAPAEVAALLDSFGLGAARSRRVGEYSSGMKQRVRLAYSLLFDPAILLWDEPFSNLDAEGIAAAREQMIRRREMGLVFLATNVRSEIEKADHEIALS